MPIRVATAADDVGIASCVSQMYQYLRARSALAAVVSDWTAATTAGFRQAGYRMHVYANTAAGGRIDAVAVWGIENRTHAPDVAPRPWMAIKILAVRALTLAEAQHETNSLRALKLAVPASVPLGAIGVVAEYWSGWRKLHDFLATFAVAEFEPAGEQLERFWGRFRPGLPEFTTRTAGV